MPTATKSTRAALAPYRGKRNFGRTQEPEGEPEVEAGHSFCVQKHAAGRLHYDFRLELDGVLKSWAVPKGPSLVAGRRRLAVAVEDHPVEYGSFEGVIPEGEYGGGTVLLWDRGTWSPIGDPHQGLDAGKLEFELHGDKLRGKFVLVRLKDEPTTWLLLKKKDAHARTSGEIIDEAPNSVATDRDLAAIAEANDATPKQRRRAKALSPEPGDVPLPEDIEPELATAVDQPPEGDDWIHEIKLDGYRILCRIDGEEVRISSRNRLDWTERLPTLVAALRRLELRNAILDGELVSLDEGGHTRFADLVDALGRKATKGLTYHVFDLLFLDGEDLRDRPLLERKERLAALCEGAPAAIRYTAHLQGRGPAFLEAAREHELEGIVSKRAAAPYRSGRGRDWLKVKLLGREELVIVGYTPPKHAKDGFGALLLAVKDDDDWRFAGKVGTGFSDKTRRALMTRLEPLHVDRTVLPRAPKGPGLSHVQWVAPELVAEVEFTEWTKDGRLRHPSFEGLREDKPADDVEAPITTPAPARPAPRSLGVALTNPDKVLVADVGLTKRALAAYYEAVANLMLPHAEQRPLMLLRCPDGTAKACFYQKHAGNSVPAGIESFTITEADGTDEEALAIVSAEGIVGTVQMGALEIHVWGCRRDDPERPDRIVIDLDPDAAVRFDDVVAAAGEVRQRFADAGLESFVMSTGGKGLHVVAPVQPEHDFAAVKDWTHTLALEMVRAAPRRFVATASKQRRRGKIFLDYLRNGRGSTAICPYSSRARPGAPIALPLAWDELDELHDAPALSIEAVLERLAARGDAWVGYPTLRQRLRLA